MAYIPSLADIPKENNYTPSLKDADEAEKVQLGSIPTQSPSVLSNIGNTSYGFAAGAGKALGQDAFNALNLIPGVHLNPNVFGAPSGLASDIGGIAGHAAGFALPAGIAGKVAESIPMLSEAASNAIPAAERLWSQGLSGSAYGAATSPDGQRLSGGITGGLGAVAPAAILRGTIPTAGFIKNVITGTPNLSPEAQALQQQVGYLPVPYAAPGIYNKVLANIPFSGVAKQQKQIISAANDKANDIVNTLKGGQEEENIAQNVADTIQANHKAATATNSALYQKVADAADAQGVKLSSAPNLSATANTYLNNTDYPLEQKYKDLLTKYLPNPDLPAIGMGGGLKGGPLNFNEAHALQKQFANQAQSHYGNDNYLGKMYSDLSDSLKNDMEIGAKNSGDPDLYNNLLAAKQDFAQNVAPYRSNSIYPIVTGKKNLNTLQNTLFQDTPEANKIVSDLPDDIKKQVAYLKFTKAVNEDPSTGNYTASPNKLFNNYNQLSEAQKNKFFSPSDRSQFNSLGAINQFIKPGNEHLKGGIGALEFALPLMEGMHGGLGGLAGALGIGLGTSTGARVASNILTNPALRNAYLSSPNASQITNPFIDSMLSKIGVGTALQGLAANQ